MTRCPLAPAVGLAAALAGPVGLAAPSPAAAPEPLTTGLEVGQLFPAIALPSLKDGRPVSIADFRGKKVVLQVFASW